jgi:protein-L-isoaspartate(D-aspartate) O-methyltransferase
VKVRAEPEEYRQKRRRMVDEQLRARRIIDPRVLTAMETVPRHLFVDRALASQAYEDYPLPILENQTISQPYIVAAMTQALSPKETDRVLEIGTGSGYQTAVLSLLVRKVFSIERHKSLAFAAEKRLADLGITNVLVRVFDGTYGWAQEGPFDGILVAATSPTVPATLVDQLAFGGRLLIPVGEGQVQRLVRVTRLPGGRTREEDLGECRFVRLIGKHAWAEE